jgi:HK97 family phage major capsid protein
MTTNTTLVPTQFAPNILESAEIAGVALRNCTIFDFTSNSMTIPTTTANLSDARLGETSSATASAPTIATRTISMKRYHAKVQLTQELLQTSPYSLQQYINAQVGMKFAQDFDLDALGKGTTFTGAYGGSAYTQSASGLVTGVTYADIVGHIGTTNPFFWKNSKFVIDRTHWTLLNGLLDSNKRPLFDANTGAKSFCNFPFEVVADGVLNSTSTTASSTKYWVFGDLSQIWIGRNINGIQMIADQTTHADTGIIDLHYFMFAGVGLTYYDSCSPYTIQ